MNSPIVVALDYPTQQQALDMARQLDPSLCRLKVGKELFTASGPSVLEELHKLDFDVFLDLKFHDIPNTCAKGSWCCGRSWCLDGECSCIWWSSDDGGCKE